MAVSVKYFISDSSGNFINWGSDASGFSVVGKEVDISGGAGPDTVYVQAGASASLVELGNDDRIYLTGNLTDYTQVIDQDTGVYTFNRITGLAGGQSEVIKVTVSNQNLLLSFADGKVNLNAETNTRLYTGDKYQLVERDSLLPGGTPAGGVAQLQPALASTPSQFPIKVFISDSAGIDLPGLVRAGQSMIVSGSGGVDRVYVMAGTSVDASTLGLGNDKVYLTGKLSDYTQAIDPDTGIYTFTRSSGLPVGQVEVVKVTVSNESDVIVFADGRITLNAEVDPRLYSEEAGFQKIQFDWLDGSETTPGVGLSIDKLKLSVDTGLSATDFITSQATQVISGSLSDSLKSGMQLFGSVDGGKHWIDITDQVTGTSIVWSGATLLGSNSIVFKTVDAAGHEKVLAGTHDYQLDTVAPNVPSLALAKDTGISASDGITTEKEVNVAGLEAGAGWEYRVDGGAWQHGSGTGFSASSGKHSYEVRQVDSAGNYSVGSAGQLITVEPAVVTQTSSIQSVNDNFSSNNSVGSVSAPVAVANGGSMDDATPKLSGRLDAELTAGQFLAVYDTANGVKTKVGIATVNADLSWAFTPAAGFSSGQHSFTVQVESAAGPKGASSAAYQIAIHNNLSMNVIDDVGTSQGVLSSSGSAALSGLAISAEPKTLLMQGQSANVDISAFEFTLRWESNGSGPGTVIPGLVNRTVAGQVTFWVGNFDGTTTRAIQMQLTDLPDGGVSLLALQGKSHDADVLNGSFNFDTDGLVDSSYVMLKAVYPIPATTDDARPSFGGVLNAALGADEEVVIYQTYLGVKSKLGVATVKDLEWSFSPGIDLADGLHSFQAMLQRVGDASGNFGIVVSAPKALVINSAAPSQLVVITSAEDNSNYNGSIGSPTTPAALANGSSTDDETPTLIGTLDAALAPGQFLSVYDTFNGVKSKIGTAVVNADLSWTFTPAANLSSGQHSFTVQVESNAGAKGASSASYDIALYNNLSMNMFDDVGAVQGALIRPNSSTLKVFAVGGEAQKLDIYSGTSNIDISTFQWTLNVNGVKSAGTVIPGSMDRSVAGRVTFWVGTLSGAYTAAVKIELKDLPDGGVSLQELQGKYVGGNALAELTNFETSGTVNNAYKVESLAYPSAPLTDDTRPKFSGLLSTTIGNNEEVAVYQTHFGIKTKLGVATVKDLEWSFTPESDLADGIYVFQAILQPIGNATGNLGHVVSAPQNIVISSAMAIQLPTIVSVTDNFDANGSGGLPTEVATIATGSSTDDTTPTLNGTLDTALTTGQFLSVYDTFNGVKTKIGTATVNADLSWAFTPTSPLRSGQHSFTVQVEATSGSKGRASASYNIALQNNLSMSVLDDVGAAQGELITNKTSTLTSFSAGGPAQKLSIYSGVSDLDISTFQWTVNANGINSAGTLIPGSIDHSIAGQVTFWVGTLRGNFTVAVKMELKDLPNGEVNLRELKSGYVSGNALTGSTNFDTSASINNAYNVSGVVYPTPAVTDDARPTLSGSLGAILGVGEEVAVYRMHNGVRVKVGVATVDGLHWSFTPATTLADGTYFLQAMIQPAGDTTGLLGHVVSRPYSIVIDATTATLTASIASVQDNMMVNGSVGTPSAPAMVGNGGNTDDTTPTLSGTLGAALSAGQFLSVYDSVNGVKTKIGTATVNADLSWTFTPTSGLSSGQHSFTVQVESISGAQGISSPAYEVSLFSRLPMKINDDVGAVQGEFSPVAFTLNGLTPGSAPQQIITDSDTTRVDIAQFKWVLSFNGTTGEGTTIPGLIDRSVPGQITFWVGSLSGQYTVAVQMQLKDLPGGGMSLQEIRSKYVQGNALTGATDFNTSGVLLNTYGVARVFSDAPIVTDDTRPTFAGKLGARLSADEEVGIYQTLNGVETKLGVATVDGLSWSFTPSADLADGTYSFRSMLQPIGDTTGTLGHVVSLANAVVINSSEPKPTQKALITSAQDNVASNGSIGTASSPATVANGGSSDDGTPVLTGTLDAPLTTGQSLSVYDRVDGVYTKIGTAVVNSDLSWTFTPPTNLSSGLHSFTVGVESISGVQGESSPVYDIALYKSLPITLIDDVGVNQGSHVATALTLRGLQVGGAPQQFQTDSNSAQIDIASFKWVLNFNGTTGEGTLIPGLIDRSVPGQATFWVGSLSNGNTVGVQMRLKDLPGGGISLQEIQSKYVIGNALNGSVDFNTSGYTVNTYGVTSVIYPDPLIDDAKPTLTGSLRAPLGAGEEVAIYQTVAGVMTKLGVAEVDGLNWSFTPAEQLPNGTYSFQAMLQPVGDSKGTNGHVNSLQLTVAMDGQAPSQTALIVSAQDNLSVNGSMGSSATPAIIASGNGTDDLTPTLTGTLDGALTKSQFLSVYDNVNGVKTKIGNAIVNPDLSWIFTPANPLSVGRHEISVQVESLSGWKGAASSSYDVTIHDRLLMTLSDDSGPVQGTLTATQLTLGRFAVGTHPHHFLSESSTATVDVGTFNWVLGFNGTTGVGTVIPGSIDRTVPGQVSFWVGSISGSYTVAVQLRLKDLPGGEISLVEIQSKYVEGNALSGTVDFNTSGYRTDSYHVESVSHADSNGAGTAPGKLAATTFHLKSIGVGSKPQDLHTESDVVRIDLASFKWLLGFNGTTGEGTMIPGSIDRSVPGQVTFWVGVFAQGHTLAVQMSLTDLPGGGISVQQLHGKYVVGDALNGAVDFNTMGSLQDSYYVETVSYSERAVIDDGKPTIAGTLTAALATDEEVAIYQTVNGSKTKLGVASVDGMNWSFTPSTDLENGAYTFQAMVQSVGDTTGTQGHVISASITVVIDGPPVQMAVITSIQDNVSGNGSAGSSVTPATVGNGNSTDDVRPTLTGTLDAVLTAGQFLSVYDTVNGERTKIGTAIVNGDLTWAFTPATSLISGLHSFTVQVESGTGAKGASSAAYNAALYSGLAMMISDDVGAAQGKLDKGADVAIGTVPVSSTSRAFLVRGHAAEIELSSFDWDVKFGEVTGHAMLIPTTVDRSVPGQVTFWVGNYDGNWTRVVQIQLKDLADGAVGIQALQAQAHKRYALDGSLSFRESGYNDNSYSVSNVVFHRPPATDDARPNFSGVLAAPLGADEQISVYQTLNGIKTKIGVATVNDLKWSFTPDNDLADGSYSFYSVLESKDSESEKKPRVLSQKELIDIDTLTPSAVAFIASVLDNAGVNGSQGGVRSPVKVEQGFSSDDRTPTLTGTLDSTIGSFENLVIYDVIDGVVTKLGTAVVDNFNWSFTLDSSLKPGKHSFVARVESVNGHTGTFSNGYDMLVYDELRMIITEAVGKNSVQLANEGGTLDKRPTFSGVLSVALGTGEEVAIYQSHQGVTSMLGVATVVGQNWTFTPPIDLVDGAFSFKAVIQSIGNTTVANGHVISNPYQVVVDTAMPPQIAIITSAEESRSNVNATGSVISNGGVSDDLTPTLKGVLSAELSTGQILAVYDTYNNVRTKIGLASVSGTTWSFSPSQDMAPGPHSFSVQVESASGVKGTTSQHLAVILYKSLSMSVSDDVGIDQGFVGNGARTDDTRPTFAGTLLAPLGAGEELAIYQTLNGARTKIGVGVVDSNLGWSFTPSNDLAGGTYTFEASLQASGEQNDIRGHVVSAPLTVSIATSEKSLGLKVPSFVLTETAGESVSVTLDIVKLGLPQELATSPFASLQVSEVEGGTFIMNGVSVNQFAFSDVANGLVTFVHRFNSGQPKFLLSVTDGPDVVGVVKSNVEFHPVGHLIFGDGSGGGGGGNFIGGNGGNGGGGNDILSGTALGDVIFGDGSGGGEGQHSMSNGGQAVAGAAGGGNDTIYGGAGNDIIFGDGFAGEEIAQYINNRTGGHGGYGGGGSGSGNTYRSVGGGGEAEASWLAVSSGPGSQAFSAGYIQKGGGGGVSANGSSYGGSGINSVSDAPHANETSIELALSDLVYKRVLDDWNNPDSQIYKQKMGSGSDVIDGGAGSDRIMAGGGDDVVIGGLGADILWGGAGADKFIFRFGDFDGSTDEIKDFKYEEGDQILIQSGGATKLNFSYNESLRQATIKIDPTGANEFNAPVETIVVSNMDLSMMTGLISSTVLG